MCVCMCMCVCVWSCVCDAVVCGLYDGLVHGGYDVKKICKGVLDIGAKGSQEQQIGNEQQRTLRPTELFATKRSSKRATTQQRTGLVVWEITANRQLQGFRLLGVMQHKMPEWHRQLPVLRLGRSVDSAAINLRTNKGVGVVAS